MCNDDDNGWWFWILFYVVGQLEHLGKAGLFGNGGTNKANPGVLGMMLSLTR